MTPRSHARLAPVLALAALAAGCSSTGGSSASAALPEFRPIQGDHVLYLWSAGVDAWLVDPKDAGVRDALRQLDARLRELPAELDDPEFPADAVELAAQSFLGPMSLSIAPAQGDAAQQIPISVQMQFRAPTAGEAQMRAERLTRLLSQLEVPSLGVDEAYHGLAVVPLGPFDVRHGVARDGREDTLLIAANGLDLKEVDLGTLDLPAGVAPVMAFKIDYGSIVDLIETFAGPEAAEALSQAGLDDLVIQAGMGQGTDRAYGSMRTLGWVPMARKNGSLPSGPIERRALELIPEDATVALVGRTNFDSVTDALRRASSLEAGMTEGTDPMAMVQEMLGIDLERDLLDHMGETCGAYLSDSTGGGGIFSTVVFLQVKNEAGLRSTLTRLEAHLTGLAAEQEMPAMGVRHSQHRGADVATFAIPGLPIPIELSWTIHQGWLLAAMSPQGLRAAIDQISEPDGSLLDNERFRDEASGSLDDLMSLSFIDMPRFVRDGYPLAVMLGAALSNGLSSAAHPDRVPAGIVPSLRDLMRDAHATVALGRIEGDDLVVTSRGDRSVLVQLAGVVGALGPLPMLLGAGIAAGAAGVSSSEEPIVIEDMSEGMEDAPEVDGEMNEEIFVPTPDEPKEDPK